jgi:gliding motility-associated-like protein
MSEQSQPFVITVNSIPVVRITSSSISMCSNEQRILTADPAGGSFKVTNGPGIIEGNALTATGPGVISLEYTYTDLCTGTDTQSVTVNEYVTANAGPDQDLVYVFSAEMNASPPSAGTGEWSVVSGSGNISDVSSPSTAITGLSSGLNIFSWNVHNGSCTSTDEVIVEVKDIITPTVITPNNDGLNDVLIFPGLSAFSSSKLIIYDRWGDEVYRNTDYLNDWNGKDKKNRDLQSDTYYYVLTISNGRTIKGFIEIRR